MQTRPVSRRWLAAAAVLAVVALFAVAAVAGSAPAACSRCHDQVTVELHGSNHASVGCYGCHAPGAGVVAFKLTEVFGMYPAAIAGRRPAGPVVETAREACLSCHSSVLGPESVAGSGGVRIAHATCAPEGTCDSCHSTTAHGTAVRWARGPVMERCVACHNSKGADVRCTTCHAGREADKRITSGPWQVTHGPKWEQTHGMGDLDSCATCHPDDYCARCHKVAIPHDQRFGSQHGTVAKADRGSCSGCHRSARFCDACHGTRMPHAEGFLERHSKEAGVIDNPMCQRCHAVEDCQICHRRHIHPGNASFSSGLKTPPVPGGSD